MGVLIKKLNKIQVSGNFWPAVYIADTKVTTVLFRVVMEMTKRYF